MTDKPTEFTVKLGSGGRKRTRSAESLRAVTIGYAPSTESPPSPKIVERMYAISASIDAQRASQAGSPA